MPFEIWLAFTATLIAVVLVPGPAVLLVVSHGMSGDRRAGFLASLGIAGSSAVFFLLTAAGLSAVLLASATAFEVVRWCGVVYLVWGGVQMILGARSADLTGAPDRNAPGYRPFFRALALQSGSPNAIAFFTALLPQFIDPAGDASRQFLFLGVTSVVVEVIVLGSYTVLAQRVRRAFDTPAALVWQKKISGGVLLTSALGLALANRR